MSEQEATTDEVRFAFIDRKGFEVAVLGQCADDEAASAVFERWLAEVERAAAEKAWHEGSVFGQRTGQGVGAVDQSAYNPYREGNR